MNGRIDPQDLPDVIVSPYESAVVEWARVRKALRVARKDALKELNYTEDGLKKLEEAATAEADEEQTVTEYGVVCMNEAPVYLHKSSELFGYKRSLSFRAED